MSFLWQWIDELLLSVFQTLISSCPVTLQGDITLSDGGDCIIQLSISVLSSTPEGVIGPISGFSDWVNPNCVCPLSSEYNRGPRGGIVRIAHGEVPRAIRTPEKTLFQ